MVEHANPTRLKALDTLRGFAALTVVFLHLSSGIIGNWYLSLSPFYILVSGHEAVTFFFLLSGYILTHQYGTQKNYNYGHFIVKRVFRLYVPYIATLGFTYLLMQLCSHHTTAKPWLTQLWQTPITTKLVIQHLILITDFDTMALNGVIWSLVHEMRIALVFPVILYLLRYSPVKIMVFCFFISIFSLLAGAYFERSMGFNSGYTHTLYYFYVFVAGGVLARHQSYLLSAYSKMSFHKKRTWFIIAVLIYSYAHAITYILGSSTFTVWLSNVLQDALVVLASFYLIIAGIAISKYRNFFTEGVPVFLGKISYSLYLVHIPVSAFLYFILINRVSVYLLPFIGFGASVITSVLFYYLVERPAQKAANRLVAGFNPRISEQP